MYNWSSRPFESHEQDAGYSGEQPFFLLEQTSSFPELDDPTFWSGIASQVDTTSILHPDLPAKLPAIPHRQPTGEGWLSPASSTTALTVYQQPALPASQRTGAKKQVHTRALLLFGIVLFGILIASFAPANDSTQPSSLPMSVRVAPGSQQSGASYAVTGPPTITADFINRVLASYNSPAAGDGQALYDLGVRYGIDPVFALAFFMHESSFGRTGEARATLSLGNLRCIPTRPCIDQDRGGYAQMYSWEDGFEQWYELIRNLYVAQWGRVTVDQIIPKYAPNSDGNNEAEYIATLERTVDTWRNGKIRV